MGRLENGQWIVEEVNPKTSDGKFKRQEQKFRDKIEEGGKHPPKEGRYHLYVSYACPWAQRVLIMRELKGLQDIISFSVVSPNMLDQGWTFKKDFDGVKADDVFQKEYLKDVYTEVDSGFSGRVTVPVLLDKETKTIVNNESADIMRIFNTAFNKLTHNNKDYYPASFQKEIDEINEDVYHNINNGVYKAGFARSQEAYDEAAENLFAALDRVDAILSKNDYLVKNKFTEADIRLFTTLVRFDAVYFTHFKCNKKMIRDYPGIQYFLRRLMTKEAFYKTTFLDHIKQHYYYSHEALNPFKIVPIGPDIAL